MNLIKKDAKMKDKAQDYPPENRACIMIAIQDAILNLRFLLRDEDKEF